jgi:Fe-S cluster biogenesis protein NfuA
MLGLLKTKRSRDDIQRQINDELAALVPLLSIDPCQLALVRFDEGTGSCVIRFAGECPDCNASAATFFHGIETRLRLRVPEIRELKVEKSA